MERIPLNELPAWSDWPARLLGIQTWKIPTRDITRIEQEYNRKKYAKCLAYYEQAAVAARPTAAQIEAHEFQPLEREIACSIGDEIYRVTLARTLDRYRALLRESMADRIAEVDSVVELGSGYGAQLWHLRQAFRDKHFVGGEYAANAVALAARLYDGMPDIAVHPFDFYAEAYDAVFGRNIVGRAVVFTSHAVGQLPSAVPFLNTLQRYADRIRSVFHFEPVAGLFDNSLLGLMRRRYSEINDYNLDLLEQLEARPNIRVLQRRPNVMGRNPLTPVSVVEWVFR